MNYRKSIGFLYLKARGDKFPAVYKNIKKSIEFGDYGNVGNKCLLEILEHCKKNIPYYRNVFDSLGDIELRKGDPIEILKKIPTLTKDIIRRHFQDLQSKDLNERKWYYNTSGGSTGEPIRLIQDREYSSRGEAITYLHYWLVGHEIGERMVMLWGSERDILESSVRIKEKIKNSFWNIKWMNAFRMTPEKMKQYISLLDSSPPDLLLAYAQSIYELALFAERSGIRVASQRAIMTSAGTLYPFMREKIEEVFRCKVFNRYGSREAGPIACEHPGSGGLWVAPWGCYIEIVDEYGNPVPPGVEGDILVTSLINFAMPLIRYKIGDRGVLSPDSTTPSGLRGQILRKVSGRNVDMFKCRDGTLIDGEYFTHILYFRDWVRKFQFIQKDFDMVAVNMVKADGKVPDGDLEDITGKIQVLLGKGCRVEYSFVEDISPSPSGKYRYTISEVKFN
jgi:phenylacetate-CoA ligase